MGQIWEQVIDLAAISIGVSVRLCPLALWFNVGEIELYYSDYRDLYDHSQLNANDAIN
jgi:hypothetical protein